MAKGIIIFIFTALIIFSFYSRSQVKKQKEVLKKNAFISSQKVSPTIIKKNKTSTTSIFIPYWSNFKNSDAEIYNRLFYFGVSVNKGGVIKDDPGFSNIDKFISFADTKEKWLVIKMIDSENNLAILENQFSWEKIVDDVNIIVNNYKFTGVALDLELNSLPFTNLIDQINSFVKYFYSNTKGYDFSLIIYGDNFYRKRPFDMNFLSENSDEIMVMAYDFHKSRGETGANFPLDKGENDDYDLKSMTEDFLRFVPSEKLTIVFGMYGYDWTVDEKKRPIKPARALTLNEIKKGFIDNCQWKNCLIKRDEKAAETEINYIDENENYHIIWFEDRESVNQKIKFLKENGIGSFAYWAYGYF